jgi:Zn-dependent protease
MGNINYADLAIWFPAFLLSLTFHEAAHAFIGKRLGDLTAANQASLNPIPHIQQEPIGTVVIPLITFLLAGWTIGWASTPYDPRWAARYPKRAGWMSASGPLSNFLLAGLTLAVIWILIAAGVLVLQTGTVRITEQVGWANGELGFLAKFLGVLYFLNLILGFFNLIPVPPLDGAGIIQGFFAGSRPAQALASLAEGTFGLFGILIAWVVFRYLLSPIVVWIAFAGFGNV